MNAAELIESNYTAQDNNHTGKKCKISYYKRFDENGSMKYVIHIGMYLFSDSIETYVAYVGLHMLNGPVFDVSVECTDMTVLEAEEFVERLYKQTSKES